MLASTQIEHIIKPCTQNRVHRPGGTGKSDRGSIMKWQIEQYSTGKVMTEVFFETEKAERLIELVAHLTGIAVDDLDAVWLAA